MQYKNKSFFTVAASAALASTAMAAYVPSEPWTALTPTATYSDAVTDYTSSFGIAVNPITVSTSASSAKVTSSAAGKNKKRDAVSQIGDGQIQATTATKSTAAPVSQIGDGQVQATTATKSTAAPVSQISDGQVQATTATKSTAAPVSQISDGQVQATTATKSTAAPVSQISDGQAQATTATKSSATAASQVSDGQIQATTGSSTSTSAGATSSSKSTEQKDDEFVKAQSCQSSGTLSMTLKDGVLTDNKGRIGSIVANRQFQFDGPPPQAGAIYAKGWGITPEGNLAIGDEDVFYQCLSGDFYNLYDEHIGDQCTPIHLEVIELINC